MNKFLKTPLMIFALIVAALVLLSMIYTRLSSSSYETEAANIAGVTVAGRLKKVIIRAQKLGTPVTSCRDQECEKAFPGFRLPRGVSVVVDAKPEGVTVTARQELATTDAVWDSRNSDEIVQIDIP